MIIEKQISHVFELVNIIEKQEDSLPIMVRWGNKEVALSSQIYIADECMFFFSEDEDGIDLDGKGFIEVLEYEAHDECWHTDIRTSAFTKVTDCQLFIATTIDKFEEYTAKIGTIVGYEITNDKILLIVENTK